LLVGANRDVAGGTPLRIRKVRVGDRVLATNPRTGRTSARRVTGVWVHRDRIVRLKVGGETLATTANHPFWNATRQRWQPAARLTPGDTVLTAHGHRLRVVGLIAARPKHAPAYNLTVAHVHTHHVGRLAVLVHNCAGGGGPTVGEILRPGGQWIGKEGNSQRVREIAGGDDDAQRMFDELSRGGNDTRGGSRPPRQPFVAHVPHPEADDLIFYPDRHFGHEPTAEEVVDRALSYRPVEPG
jgi:hypothetical protein